jgi:hypothetical protein
MNTSERKKGCVMIVYTSTYVNTFTADWTAITADPFQLSKTASHLQWGNLVFARILSLTVSNFWFPDELEK